MIFDIDSDPSDLIIIFLGISSNNVDKSDKAPVARYIVLHQTHKYIHVTGSRKNFKKELLSQKKIKGQIRL